MAVAPGFRVAAPTGGGNDKESRGAYAPTARIFDPILTKTARHGVRRARKMKGGVIMLLQKIAYLVNNYGSQIVELLAKVIAIAR